MDKEPNQSIMAKGYTNLSKYFQILLATTVQTMIKNIQDIPHCGKSRMRSKATSGSCYGQRDDEGSEKTQGSSPRPSLVI